MVASIALFFSSRDENLPIDIRNQIWLVICWLSEDANTQLFIVDFDLLSYALLLDLCNGPGSSVDSEVANLFRVLRQTRVASVLVPSGACFAILSDCSAMGICWFLRVDSLLSNVAWRPPLLTAAA